jgi:hypothetical protein
MKLCFRIQARVIKDAIINHEKKYPWHILCLIVAAAMQKDRTRLSNHARLEAFVIQTKQTQLKGQMYNGERHKQVQIPRR